MRRISFLMDLKLAGFRNRWLLRWLVESAVFKLSSLTLVILLDLRFRSNRLFRKLLNSVLGLSSLERSLESTLRNRLKSRLELEFILW